MPDPHSDLAIDVRGLTKSYGKLKVVNKVDIHMPRGQVWGFLGPNGSGKTTTIRMRCGLLRPDAGQGTCLGYDILKQSREIKRQVGYMTQKFSYWEDLSIRENLEFVANLYDLKSKKQVVDKTLETLGLTSRQKQLAGTLSGGWKQRLALAACLIHDPQLLLLDEPTAGVDPKARREFWDEIHQLAAGGLTVLITTHYMDEAERCHRLAYIAYGNLLASGTMEDVLKTAGLTTWEVTGANLPMLAEKIRLLPGVEQVVAFGTALHVSGRDGAKLNESVKPWMTGEYHWQKIESGLEEVLISRRDTAKDNFS